MQGRLDKLTGPAGIAQSVEQLTRNEQVRSSNLLPGSTRLAAVECTYEGLTLELRGGEEIRSESPATHASEDNQQVSYGAEQKISGDRTGEYTRVCEPVAADDFQCIGAFLLEGGSIAFSSTGEDDNPTVAVVTGGTGAYDGARGSLEIDHETDRYTVHLALPND